MAAGEQLINIMRDISKEVIDSGIEYGEIISLTPLKVQIDQKRILTEYFLLVSSNLTELSITIPHTHSINDSNTSDAEPNTFVIRQGLSIGDKVLMLKLKNGKSKFLYYIVEKVN